MTPKNPSTTQESKRHKSNTWHASYDVTSSHESVTSSHESSNFIAGIVCRNDDDDYQMLRHQVLRQPPCACYLLAVGRRQLLCGPKNESASSG
jgi:hypothetical protein